MIIGTKEVSLSVHSPGLVISTGLIISTDLIISTGLVISTYLGLFIGTKKWPGPMPHYWYTVPIARYVRINLVQIVNKTGVSFLYSTDNETQMQAWAFFFFWFAGHTL